MKNYPHETLFTATLLKWHQNVNKRVMPWTGETDPYKIWLSEVILQQTRVEQGWDYYKRFIQHFPNIKLLAAAPDDQVFKLWEGLGYYSRCKNLLHTARYISNELNANFPRQYEDILRLKGVGTYTAAAIASFAYNQPYAVIDGNVNRVLSRFFGIATPIDSKQGKQIFSELAARLLPAKKAGIYNQAIMDFGATVCKPQLPLCPACPLNNECVAYQQAMLQELPVKEKKIKKVHRWFYYIVAEKGNRVLVNKRTAKDIWQNLHEFVLIEVNEHQGIEALQMQEGFGKIAGKHYEILGESKIYKQQLTHQTIHAVFLRVKLKAAPKIEGAMWVSKAQLRTLAFPRLVNHFLEQEYGYNALPG